MFVVYGCLKNQILESRCQKLSKLSCGIYIVGLIGFQIDAAEVEGLVKDLDNKVANTATFTDFLDIVIARQADSIEVFEELNQNWKLFDLKVDGVNIYFLL